MTKSAGPALLKLHARFKDRVKFVDLYVREAHPGSRFPQPRSFEEKLAHARAYQQRDGVSWPIAVDDVEGTLHRALDPKPHSAYLVDARGDVSGRILWANHLSHLEHALEALARGEPVGDDESKAVPLLRGLGRIDEVLAESGGYARDDFAREVPPMFAMARLARVFAPLPPVGRAVAAMATVMGTVALAAVGIRALVRRNA
ncbi:MAG: hypothetical protein NVS2B9_00570 [Myxococcales bacterium]